MELIYFVYLEEEPLRIDKFLVSEIDEISRSLIQIYIKDNHVLVNDKVVKANYILKKGDEISVTIPDPVSYDIIAQDIPLDIYYEDNDVIVINKPTGMVVHPAVGNYQNTLVNALMFHCHDLSGINGVIRAGIVHRIDKDTSGLLVACKNDLAHKNLSEQFFRKTILRKYYAIVYGVINHNVGRIEAPIGRNMTYRQQMAVVEQGKPAVTNFKVLERFKKYTYVELSLETGRTHQIRVHMQYIGYPLVGDTVYGPKHVIGETGQFLHAKSLGFIHPRTKEYLEFDSPLPQYFEDFLNEIRQEE
ncbi:MAG TPA: RluA family pseudouridine synthase [Bacilli bacterium]|nr:RluA family pseudouridine synthase [Bacilli bacterium]